MPISVTVSNNVTALYYHQLLNLSRSGVVHPNSKEGQFRSLLAGVLEEPL